MRFIDIISNQTAGYCANHGELKYTDDVIVVASNDEYRDFCKYCFIDLLDQYCGITTEEPGVMHKTHK